MDEDLATLRRAHESDPTDRTTADRFAAALRRAGDRDALADRFDFKLRCERRWESLRRTEYHNVRHCGDCDRRVYSVETLDELRIHVREGRCVAVNAPSLRRYFERLGDEPGASFAVADDGPCVVERAPPEALLGMAIERRTPEEDAVQREVLEIWKAVDERGAAIAKQYPGGSPMRPLIGQLGYAEAQLERGEAIERSGFAFLFGQEPEARELVARRIEERERAGDLAAAARLREVLAAVPIPEPAPARSWWPRRRS